MAISDDDLVQRNARFAAGGAFASLSFPTGQVLRVVSCVDSRVDPSHVLGLDLGEAVVMRNIGGRVTPAVVRSWRLLSTLGRAGAGGERPHLVVLHHTDCGIKRLAQHPEMLAEFFEVPVAELDGKAIHDPYAAVALDVGVLRAALGGGLLVSGVVYDVETGLIDVVEPAA